MGSHETVTNTTFVMPPTQLTQNHPAVKLLTRKLQDGSLSGHEKPSVVHVSDPMFAKTNINNFRTCYKNVRKRLGKMPTGKDDQADLNRKCTEDDEERALKKSKTSFSSDEDEGRSDIGSTVDPTGDPSCFMPMVAFSSWIEPRITTRRLTVVVVLPTGIDINDFSVHVVNDGNYLEFKCLWPKEVVNVETLHRKELLSDNAEVKIESYHPKLLGFESFFKDMRKRATDPVQSTCRISLPFAVETHIYKKSNLQWRNSSTRVAYIELRAEAEEYGLANTEDNFEIV